MRVVFAMTLLALACGDLPAHAPGEVEGSDTSAAIADVPDEADGGAPGVAPIPRPSVPAVPDDCAPGLFPHVRSGCQPAGIAVCADVFRGDDGVCEPHVSVCPADTRADIALGCVAFPVRTSAAGPVVPATHEALAAALAQAQPGDVVRIGDGTIEGASLGIPTSVTLSGAGAGQTQLGGLVIAPGQAVTLDHLTTGDIDVGAGASLVLMDARLVGVVRFQGAMALSAVRSRLDASPGAGGITAAGSAGGSLALTDSCLRASAMALSSPDVTLERAVIELDHGLTGPSQLHAADSAIITGSGLSVLGGLASTLTRSVIVTSSGMAFHRGDPTSTVPVTALGSLIRGPSGIWSTRLVSRGNVYQRVEKVGVTAGLTSTDDTFLLRSGTAMQAQLPAVSEAYLRWSGDGLSAPSDRLQGLLLSGCPAAFCPDRRASVSNVVIVGAPREAIRVDVGDMDLTLRHVRIRHVDEPASTYAVGLVVMGGPVRLDDVLIEGGVGVGLWLGASATVVGRRVEVDDIRLGAVSGSGGLLQGVADGVIATAGTHLDLAEVRFARCDRNALTVVRAFGRLGRSRVDHSGGTFAVIDSPGFMVEGPNDPVATPAFDNALAAQLSVPEPPTITVEP